MLSLFSTTTTNQYHHNTQARRYTQHNKTHSNAPTMKKTIFLHTHTHSIIFILEKSQRAVHITSSTRNTSKHSQKILHFNLPLLLIQNLIENLLSSNQFF